MEVVWSEPAIKVLVQLREFIRAENPSAATRVAERIREMVEVISQHPSMGRVGRVPHTREMVITQTPFLMAYSVVNNQLIILRVLHGARKWPVT